MKKAMRKLEELLEIGGIRKDVILLVISGIALLCSIFDLLPLPFDAAWAAIILCGIPIILEAVIGLVTEFDIKADVLVSLALIASVLIGEDFAAGEVAFIMQLGGLLEELTVARARAGIEKLVHLTPQTARVIRKDGETVIPAEQVQVGDILRVLPGETVPVDGIILSGQTSINQAVMTGESLPVDKAAGDEVSSGTVNQFGAFEMKAAKVGRRQFHPEDDPAGAVGRRGKGKDRQYRRSLGDLDRGDRPDSGGPYLADQRTDHPRGDDSGSFLSLRSGAGHAHGHHGSHRERYEAWISGTGRRRPGAVGHGIKDYL